MQYMMIFHETSAEMARRDDPKEAPEYWGAWRAYIGALQQSGAVVSGNGLQPPHTGTSVRVEGNKRHVQDGPLPVALDWAAKSPSAKAGRTEVRPVLPPPPSS